jgi:hypothetical protein
MLVIHTRKNNKRKDNMSKNSEEQEFEDFKSEFDEMIERAESLGFKPLHHKQDFPPRLWGLRSLYLGEETEGGDDELIKSDMYFAPKNNPIEMMTDYMMHLADENVKKQIHAFSQFLSSVIKDGVIDDMIPLFEAKSKREMGEMIEDIIMQTAHMLMKGRSWQKFTANYDIDMPQAVIIGNPEALSSMIATTNGDLLAGANPESMDKFLKEVLRDSESKNNEEE